ncbi:hypothetical protein B0H13DRAFT_1967157 [Mycena leptocephala]|nr:hypothetical protein B0H13DRAFT_1967157 [Mycena leptocephala]
MPSSAILVAVFGLVSLVAGQSSTSLAPAQITHVITVSNNQSATNGTTVFSPVLHLRLPCIPAHLTNASINGFNTDLRPAGNGTSITRFPIVMNPDIVNDTLWFYDETTCGIGGVGVINPGNVSATDETIDGFVRNAIRLNGTGATTTSSASPSASGSSSSGTGSGGGSDGSSGSGSSNTTTSAASRLAPALGFAPLFALAAALVV